MQIMDSVYMSYAAAEQGDSSSAEEVESPRSVVSAASVRRRCGGARWRRGRHQKNNTTNNNNNINNNMICYEKYKSDKIIHSQVLRIKEEELQIEEDLMGDFGIFNVVYVVASHPLDAESSKIILPASPLGSKTNC